MGREPEWNWRVSTEDDHVSLHDCVISEVFVGEDIWLFLDDGFDVPASNSCNGTGRHKRTGKAAVVLYGGMYCGGSKFFPGEPEKEIKVEELSRIDCEILDFSFDAQAKVVEIVGDAWDECVFCKLNFRADRVGYCWNEFVDDAWFQDWGEKL